MTILRYRIPSCKCILLQNQDDITHELSYGHTLWLDRVNQLKQNKSMYGQIDDSIKQFEKLIDRFNDVFIGSNSYIKSAL